MLSKVRRLRFETIQVTSYQFSWRAGYGFNTLNQNGILFTAGLLLQLSINKVRTLAKNFLLTIF